MAKQTTKPVSKKAVAAISSNKPKTSKSPVAKIAKSPAMKKLTVKKPAVKKPLTKTAGKSTQKSTKAATALPKKFAAPVVKNAAIPARKKIITAGITPAKKTPAKKTAEKKSKPASIQKTVVTPSLEERYRMVELVAYFIAEQHGFTGHTDEYWAAAEHEIAARLDPRG